MEIKFIIYRKIDMGKRVESKIKLVYFWMNECETMGKNV